MSEESSLPGHCPKCGAAIPTDAPQGLCPRCVLAGTAHGTEAGASPGHRLETPALAQVAAAFPDLEILECIGAGGMGVVYKARQTKLDRFVALKLLPLSLSADPTFAERFHREARFLARLNHQHIVSVYDFGQAGGFCFLLMEYVDGVNLRQAMQAGRFTPSEAMALVPSLCSALQYAHDQGVLHRDIKPENILLDAQGRVKLADFGIAKMMTGSDAARADITLTQSGSRLGTPHYMAPEQIEKPSQVDHRADIYSLGVVCYELLTGELPLGRFAAPSEKADLDSRIDAIVMRALAKEREQRQQSAGEVRSQVEGVAATPGDRPGATPSPNPATAVLPPRPDLPLWAKRFAAGLAAYIGLCLVSGIFLKAAPTDPSILRLVRWPMELLLLPTAVALWKRRIEWRFLGVTTASLLLAIQLMGAFLTLFQPSGLWAIQPVTRPNPVFVWTTTLLQLAMIGGCLWTLNHRDVVAAFDDFATRSRRASSQRLWHRIFWIVALVTGLPLAALVSFVLSSALIRAGHPTAAATVGGLVAMAAGGGLWIGSRKTRLALEGSADLTPLNPWPNRVFWWVAGVVLVLFSSAVVGLVIPQLARAGMHAADFGLLLLPLVMMGWVIWGYKRTSPAASAPIDVVAAAQSLRRRTLLVGIPTVLMIVLIAGSWLTRRQSSPPFLGGAYSPYLDGDFAPPIPTALSEPAQAVTGELHFKQVLRNATDSQVKLGWGLTSSKGGAIRLTVGERVGTVWLEPHPNGGYVNRIEVTFAKDNRPGLGSVLLRVAGSGGSYPQTGAGITMPLYGDPAEILTKANELVAGDLELTYSTPVWIAFAQLEQIQLEVLPNETPNGPADGLPNGLSSSATNSAAMTWRNAWLALEDTRRKAEVGAVAPKGFEILAAERDLAVAEAEFRGRPLDAALAESRYARARADILGKMAEVGKATQAELREASLQALKATEAVSRLQTAQRPATLPIRR